MVIENLSSQTVWFVANNTDNGKLFNGNYKKVTRIRWQIFVFATIVQKAEPIPMMAISRRMDGKKGRVAAGIVLEMRRSRKFHHFHSRQQYHFIRPRVVLMIFRRQQWKVFLAWWTNDEKDEKTKAWGGAFIKSLIKVLLPIYLPVWVLLPRNPIPPLQSKHLVKRFYERIW